MLFHRQHPTFFSLTLTHGQLLDLNVAKDHINDSASAAKMGSVMQDTLQRFFRLPLISVAAIEGYALGGGAELTTSCDYRILSHSTVVRFVVWLIWGRIA